MAHILPTLLTKSGVFDDFAGETGPREASLLLGDSIGLPETTKFQD